MRDPAEPRARSSDERADGDIMAGDRRIARADSALPDWHIPDASYRPVPIVWFAAAMLLQLIAITLLFLALITLPGIWTLLTMAAASGAIGAWTWRRGMNRASLAWRLATIAAMTALFAFYALGTSLRM